MKEYLDKIKNYSEKLCLSAKWHNSEKTVGSLSMQTDSASDYIYEFFCYLSVIEDLGVNYDLEYYPGFGLKENLFPKSPANKEGYPLFYIVERESGQKLYQVCAGTKVVSILSKLRAPDISFQSAGASLIEPEYIDIKMIYDAKRKRPKTSARNLGESQYSYFAIMVRELALNKPLTSHLKFHKFIEFNANCLITNVSSRRGVTIDNQFHGIKEVEFFNEKLDLKLIKVIG